jgi:ATP-dependent helicase HrpA
LLLKQQWGEKALEQLEKTSDGFGGIDNSIERQNILNWDFEPLPVELILERHGMTMTLYPGLQDEGESVAIKLYDQQKIADDNHGQGIYRLLKLMLAKELKQLQKQLPFIDKACLLFAPYGSCTDLKQDIVNAILINSIRDVVAIDEQGAVKMNDIRSQESFAQLFSAIKIALEQNITDVSQAVLNVLQANQILAKQLKGNIPFNLVTTLGDIKTQQGRLIYKGFIAQTPLIWLKRLPRYFKGMMTRLEKAKSDHRRDGLNQMQITPLWEKYEKQSQLIKEDKHTPEILFFANALLEDYRWLIEELRISLFAQELKTAQPVSVKRLEKKWKDSVQN